MVKIFFQDYLDVVYEEALKQGSMDAFKKAHADILETMADDLDEKAEELAEKKLVTMLSTVDPKQVVRLDKKMGVVYIGDEKADEGRLLNLHSEAEFILASELWKLIHETPKELAHKAMFVNSESLVDLQKGKSMLYTLDTQKAVIDLFKNYSPREKK